MGRRPLYIVTGAAGHLGSTILRALSGRDCAVRGLLLPSQSPAISAPNIAYIHGDILESDSLHELFQDSEGHEIRVIHTAAIVSIEREVTPILQQVNVEGTRNIVEACREREIGRLVYVSSVHAIPELPAGQIIREPDALSPDLVVGGYAKTKAVASQLVLDAAADGLDAVVVFPSGILGPYDEGTNHLVQLIVDYTHGRMPLCVAGGYDVVDVRDVADGCVRAAQFGRRGESYILNGRYVSIRDLLAMAAARCGRRPPPALPLWLAHLAVPFAAGHACLRHRRPIFTSYSLQVLTSNGCFSSAKARDELGYRARDLADTVRDTMRWLDGPSR
ncbi:NAD-dependent epimerase/dehydratase family protein [Coriobacteriales bacterium OH1046]|nr:NAD-dependent epimerase/dehydratase family protein [Coriobacteriales bacterium OH1046]